MNEWPVVVSPSGVHAASEQLVVEGEQVVERIRVMGLDDAGERGVGLAPALVSAALFVEVSGALVLASAQGEGERGLDDLLCGEGGAEAVEDLFKGERVMGGEQM